MRSEDFPILNQEINGKKLVYLDNSATTQKPKQVIQSIVDFYNTSNANVHRGIHELSQRATSAYEKAHKNVATFIGAYEDEIIFTKGTTDSLNMIALSLKEEIQRGDEIVISEMEHHSNIVPWQQLAKEKQAKLKFIPVKDDFTLDMEKAKEMITDKTKIVSIVHISNTLGTINPVRKIAKLAHKVGAYMIVDAAQSVPHMKVDVQDLDCDFLAFSGHKMCAPTGIGVLYGKRKLLRKIQPAQFGGGMINTVTKKESTWTDIPEKFEAGTPNISGAIALAAACEYLTEIGMDQIYSYDSELTNYAIKRLKRIDEFNLFGPATKRGAVISFTIDNIHPHDISEILNQEGVAIRAGNHCTMPLHKKFKLFGTSRASFYFYNTKDDVDKLVKAIKKAKEVFK
jgi:cysteine desulfurase / selenocysteine lyase